MRAISTIGKNMTFNGRGEKAVPVFNTTVPVNLRYYLNEMYNRRVAEIIDSEWNKTAESSFVSSQKVVTYGLAVYNILSASLEVTKSIASVIEQEYSKINIEERMPDAEFSIRRLRQLDFKNMAQVMDWICNYWDAITDICDLEISKAVLSEFGEHWFCSTIYSWHGWDNESWWEVIITSYLNLVLHMTWKRFEKKDILEWREENSKSGVKL